MLSDDTAVAAASHQPIGSGAIPARPATQASKQALVARLLDAKETSGKTYSQIGKEIGCTNFYTAALFHNQQQLKPETAKLLKQAVPNLEPTLLAEMKKAPSRRYRNCPRCTRCRRPSVLAVPNYAMLPYRYSMVVTLGPCAMQV